MRAALRSGGSLRPVAESNRSKRFCRPLTKSLIQPAVLLKAGAKVQQIFELTKYFSTFLANLLKKGTNRHR